MDSTDHANAVREAFTRQARDYASSATITDSEKIERLVRATDVSSGDRVLDVATGPGHVAFGFAAVCEDVVGVDLTDAPLEIASGRNRERDGADVHFVKGDATNLPFGDCRFDVVVCRLAVHHVESPATLLREMARVCRPGGTVAVEDLTVSEFTERAAYQNRFERLRDPSHVRALSLRELLDCLTDRGIEVTSLTSGTLLQEVEQWLDLAQTPDARAETVRALIEADADEDLSGTRPFREDGDLYFTQRTATLVGRRLAGPDGSGGQ